VQVAHRKKNTFLTTPRRDTPKLNTREVKMSGWFARTGHRQRILAWGVVKPREQGRGGNKKSQEKGNRQAAQAKSGEDKCSKRACAKVRTVGVGIRAVGGAGKFCVWMLASALCSGVRVRGAPGMNLWSRHPKTPIVRTPPNAARHDGLFSHTFCRIMIDAALLSFIALLAFDLVRRKFMHFGILTSIGPLSIKHARLHHQTHIKCCYRALSILSPTQSSVAYELFCSGAGLIPYSRPLRAVSIAHRLCCVLARPHPPLASLCDTPSCAPRKSQSPPGGAHCEVCECE
jgi:hypothetical protein